MGFGEDWRNIFMVALWWIWRWRNEIIFRNMEFDPIWIKGFILNIREEIIRANEKDTTVNRGQGINNAIVIKWNKPPYHVWALNVDGCFKGRSCRAGYGGVLPDSQGQWIAGFIGTIVADHALEAESWAVWNGLEWAWKNGYRKIILQSDSEEVINWLCKNEEPVRPLKKSVEE